MLDRIIGAAEKIIRDARSTEQSSAPVTIAALFRIVGVRSKKKKLEPLGRRTVELHAAAVRAQLAADGHRLRRVARGAWIVTLTYSPVPEDSASAEPQIPGAIGLAGSASDYRNKALRGCRRVALGNPRPPAGRPWRGRLPRPAHELATAATWALEDLDHAEDWRGELKLRSLAGAVGVLAFRQGLLVEDMLKLGRRAARATHMSWRDGLTWKRPAYFVGVLRQMIADRPVPDLAKVRTRIAAQAAMREKLEESMRNRGA